MSVIIDGTTGITSPANITVAVDYTGTLTGGTGILNIGSGQLYKDASGNVGIGTITPFTGSITFANAKNPVISQNGGFFGGGVSYEEIEPELPVLQWSA